MKNLLYCSIFVITLFISLEFVNANVYTDLTTQPPILDSRIPTCRSYSDPNIITFDNSYYQFHLESDHFILFDNFKDTRVTVGYEKSGQNSTRNCALYVKKARKLLFVDFCQPASDLFEASKFYGVWVQKNRVGIDSIRDPPKCPIIQVDQEDSESTWNKIDKYIGNFRCARLQGANYYDTYIIRTVERRFEDTVKIKVQMGKRILPNIEVTAPHSNFNNTGGLCGMWDDNKDRELFVLDRDGVEHFVDYKNSEDIKVIADFWKLHSRYNKDHNDDEMQKRCPECYLMAERSFYCPCDDFNLFDIGNYEILPPGRTTYCKVPMGLCIEKYIYNKNDSCLPPLPTTTTTERTTIIELTTSGVSFTETDGQSTDINSETTINTLPSEYVTTSELFSSEGSTNYESTETTEQTTQTTKKPQITISEAKEICTSAILQNPTIKVVIRLGLFDPEFTLEVCVNDIINSNDASAADSHVHFILDLIINLILTNPDNFNITEEFISGLCINNCNNNGVCILDEDCFNSTSEGCLSPVKCICDEPYSGRDCSRDKREIPTLDLDNECCDLRNEKCDLVGGLGCTYDTDDIIYVKIELIEETETSTRTIVEYTTAERVGNNRLSIKINKIKELILYANINNLPAEETILSATAIVKVYISYLNDTFDEFSSFVLYDSLCRECIDQETILLPDRCEIDGRCYKTNDTSETNENEYCDPDVDPNTWTVRPTKDPLCDLSSNIWVEANLDSPDGDGDLELYGIFKESYGCFKPSVILIETVDGVPYNLTGQNLLVDDCYGFMCLNSQNSDGCLDYKIRQCCPITSTLTPTSTTRRTTVPATTIETTEEFESTEAPSTIENTTVELTDTPSTIEEITGEPTDAPSTIEEITGEPTDAQSTIETTTGESTIEETPIPTEVQSTITDQTSEEITDATTTILTTEPNYPDNITISSCTDWWNSGLKEDGYYYIYPDNENKVLVYCDMEEGGWTIILNKFEAADSSVFYDRTYQEYVVGLGNPINSNFWLGLRNIRYIINDADFTEMRIEGSNNNLGENGFAIFDGFNIEGATNRYSITFGTRYVGNLPDVGQVLNDNQFSAKDNDLTDGECPSKYGGGWWFNQDSEDDCYNGGMCLTCASGGTYYKGQGDVTDPDNYFVYTRIRMAIKTFKISFSKTNLKKIRINYKAD